ncbi:hypothetical protein AVEN_256372-1 [Araneus ventricosus]|uniref:Reverse transcriptase RNase H-like domain-containing protein n=1 Tax=Araneus ventricosus TaxID=182803 RepID=A0A4Y2KQ74_ARAVE|nr:hypothetical protein AVEN_256372-1 [Araneus ventricosus]
MDSEIKLAQHELHVSIEHELTFQPISNSVVMIETDSCERYHSLYLLMLTHGNRGPFHIPRSENVAADTISRVPAITFPSKIGYAPVAKAQNTDRQSRS